MKTTTLFAALIAAGSFGFTGAAMAGGPKHCPPGLAKKGCEPPGQAKKRYQVGQPLPADVVYAPVTWQQRYPAPPAGTTYARVDQDIVLIAEGTRRVIELIAIADALSN